MKIIGKTEYPCIVRPGDEIYLRYGDETVLKKSVTKKMKLTGGILFELEPGDIPGVKCGIGGALIEEEVWAWYPPQ